MAEEEVVEGAPAKLLAWARSLAELSKVGFEPARLRGHIRIGRVAPSLLQPCIDYDADLILAGTHARRGVERLRLGSVAETLVREAPCPVLIARPKDYVGRTKTALPDQPYGPGEAPWKRGEVPFERTISVSMDGWCASDDSPTGIRII